MDFGGVCVDPFDGLRPVKVEWIRLRYIELDAEIGLGTSERTRYGNMFSSNSSWY